MKASHLLVMIWLEAIVHRVLGRAIQRGDMITRACSWIVLQLFVLHMCIDRADSAMRNVGPGTAKQVVNTFCLNACDVSSHCEGNDPLTRMCRGCGSRVQRDVELKLVQHNRVVLGRLLESLKFVCRRVATIVDVD